MIRTEFVLITAWLAVRMLLFYPKTAVLYLLVRLVPNFKFH